jgi:hypothetical protein
MRELPAVTLNPDLLPMVIEYLEYHAELSNQLSTESPYGADIREIHAENYKTFQRVIHLIDY